MLAQGAKYQKRAPSTNTLIVCCFDWWPIAYLQGPADLVKNVNFLFFNFFQKIVRVVILAPTLTNP